MNSINLFDELPPGFAAMHLKKNAHFHILCD
jgi:hypothetical protein